MTNNAKGTTPTITRDINAAERATLALKLRAQKATYQEIAQLCGYADRGSAHNAVQRELQRTVVSNVDELRREELHSLDRLELECWKRLQDKAFSKAMLFAVDRIVTIKERRARLMGLDVKVENASSANVVVIREIPAQYLGIEEAKP